MTQKKREALQQDWTIETGLSREEELLIHCARLELSGSRHEAVKDLLVRGLNWDLLLEKAAWHRLSCLVCHHLKSADLSVLVPPHVLQKLQRLKYASLARNMLLQDELSSILSAFNKEGIPVIVLKGSALLGSIYRDISLRPMSDLDLLVPPEHLDVAEAVALHKDYASVAASSVKEHARTSWQHLPCMINLKKGIALEIHHKIVGSDSQFHFDISSFWSRAQPFSVAGTVAKKFAPEDQIVHLCIKILLDRRYKSNAALGQLCDISEIIFQEGNSLNWDLLLEVAEEHHIGRGIHCVLYLCKKVLGSQIPEAVLFALKPSEFDPSVTELFFRRRVLGTSPWLAHDLTSSRLPYSGRRVLPVMIKRFFQLPDDISLKKRSPVDNMALYIKRMKDIVPRLSRVIFRPSDLKQDLLLDRWLHNTCSRDVH